jgi:hypothetical protein
MTSSTRTAQRTGASRPVPDAGLDMAANDHPGGTVLLEAAHRTQPRLEAAMVGLDPVVGVLVGAMPCKWQLLQHGRVDRRPIGGDLDGPDLARADGPLKEPPGSRGISPSGDEHVDDLPELVDRTADIAPPPGDPHLRLVHRPAISHGVATRSGSLSQQRRAPKHTHRYTVTWSTSTPRSVSSSSRSRYDSPEAQLPADRQDDHLGRKAKPAKADCGTRPRRGRRVLMLTVWLRHAVAADATVPQDCLRCGLA